MGNATVIKLTNNGGTTLLPITDSAYIQHRFTDNSISSARDAINAIHQPGSDDQILKGTGTAESSATTSSVAKVQLIDHNGSTIDGEVGIKGSAGSPGYASVYVSYNSPDIKIKVAYTDTNTDTKVTSAANHYTPSGTAYSLIPSGSGSLTHNSSFVVTGLSYAVDSKGHITSITATQGKLPTDSDTKVTAVGNHYTPTGAVKNATKGTDGAQLVHNSSMVMTGINWKADAAGHVTEVSYTLAKLPSDSDTKVTAVGNHYTPTGTEKNGTDSTSSPKLSWGSKVTTKISYHSDAAGHVTKVTYFTQPLPDNPVPPTNVVRDSTSWNQAGFIVTTTATDKTITKSTYMPTNIVPNSASTDTTVPTSKAVWDAIDDAMGDLAGALIYKGTIAGSTANPQLAPYGALTPAASQGDVYIVSAAGKINGEEVEIGDMLICKTDTSASTASDYSTIKDNWNIITGENQWSINEITTIPANGNFESALTIEGKTLSLSHGTPTGSVKNATKGTDGSQLVQNSSFVLTGINWKADANGHVTEVSYTRAKLPADNDTKVTAVGNHYTPTGAVKNATKGTDGAQLVHNSSMVMTGINWKADAAGHVTEVSYTLAKLPADTHHISYNIIAASATAKTPATSTTTNTTTFLNHIENNTVRSAHQIQGTGWITVAYNTTDKKLYITSSVPSTKSLSTSYTFTPAMKYVPYSTTAPDLDTTWLSTIGTAGTSTAIGSISGSGTTVAYVKS